MFSFLKKKPPVEAPAPVPPAAPATAAAVVAAPPSAAAATPAPERASWIDRLKSGLRKTGGNISAVFVNAQIDEALYEELEDALLMADTGRPGHHPRC